MKAMVKAVIVSLNVEKKKRDTSETATAEWYKDLKPTLLRIGAVTLAPSTVAGKSSGLTFHYPPCTLLSVRRQCSVDWQHGPICREQPYPPVPRAPA
jgi:hypothetical protein